MLKQQHFQTPLSINGKKPVECNLVCLTLRSLPLKLTESFRKSLIRICINYINYGDRTASLCNDTSWID